MNEDKVYKNLDAAAQLFRNNIEVEHMKTEQRIKRTAKLLKKQWDLPKETRRAVSAAFQGSFDDADLYCDHMDSEGNWNYWEEDLWESFCDFNSLDLPYPEEWQDKQEEA